MQIKLLQEIFTKKLLASLWKWRSLKLGNGLFITIIHWRQKILISVFHNITCNFLHCLYISSSYLLHFFNYVTRINWSPFSWGKILAGTFTFQMQVWKRKTKKPINYKAHLLNIFQKHCYSSSTLRNSVNTITNRFFWPLKVLSCIL